MVKSTSKPSGSTKSSRQRLRISLSIPQRTTRVSTGKWISRKKTSHQRAKYLKYKKLNKAFAKKKIRVILDDPSDTDYSSSSESHNSKNEDEKTSITYDSESGNDDKSSNSSTNNEKEIWNNCCRDGFIINKLNNSKSNIKEHKLSSNNLNTAINYSHLLNTMKKPSKKDKKPNPIRNWNMYI